MQDYYSRNFVIGLGHHTMPVFLFKVLTAHHGDWIAVNCGSMPGDPARAEAGIVVQAEDFRPGTKSTKILFTSELKFSNSDVRQDPPA